MFKLFQENELKEKTYLVLGHSFESDGACYWEEFSKSIFLFWKKYFTGCLFNEMFCCFNISFALEIWFLVDRINDFPYLKAKSSNSKLFISFSFTVLSLQCFLGLAGKGKQTSDFPTSMFLFSLPRQKIVCSLEAGNAFLCVYAMSWFFILFKC